MKWLGLGRQTAFYEVDVAGEGRCPVRVAVNFQTIDGDGLEFGKTDVSPFGHFIIAIQNSESKKQVVAVILGDIPVAPTDEEVEVDEFFLGWNVFSFVQMGNPVELFLRGRVPHQLFLSVMVFLF